MHSTVDNNIQIWLLRLAITMLWGFGAIALKLLLDKKYRRLPVNAFRIELAFILIPILIIAAGGLSLFKLGTCGFLLLIAARNRKRRLARIHVRLNWMLCAIHDNAGQIHRMLYNR